MGRLPQLVPQPRRRLRRPGALAVLLAVLLAPPAAAQQTFSLTDEGWQQQQAFPPNSPEGRLQAIRAAIAEKRSEAAEELASGWIRAYPNHPRLAEAYLLRADAKALRQRYYKALYDYEYVIRAFPASTEFQIALEREYEIARLYLAGINRHFLGMRILPAEGEGEELLIRIQERAPGSELGEKASLLLADYYFRKAQMPSAAEAYDLFLLNYPQSAHREWAMLRLIQASLARFKGPEFDPTGLIEASQRLRMYREEYPAAADRLGADALIVRIDESLALKELVTARWYEQRSEPISAAYVYTRVVNDYPQTAAAQTALQRLNRLDVESSVLPGSPPAVDTP